YARFAEKLSNLTVYGIQAEAVVTGNGSLATVEEMADDYCSLVRPIARQKSCWIGGWSSGGLIAYEMARRMRTQNQPSNPLLLFDTYPPNGELPYRPGAASEAEIIFDFVGSNVNLDLEYMGTLPQDALLDYAIG